MYFTWKYEIHIRRKYPYESGDLTLFPFHPNIIVFLRNINNKLYMQKGLYLMRLRRKMLWSVLVQLVTSLALVVLWVIYTW